MSSLPPSLRQTYRTMLEHKAIPDGSQSYYVRWLAMYWTACQQQGWDILNPDNLASFIAEIRKRHPSPFLQQQAREAIKLFFALPHQGHVLQNKSEVYFHGLKPLSVQKGTAMAKFSQSIIKSENSQSQEKPLTSRQKKRIEELTLAIKTKLVDTLKHLVGLGQDFIEIKELVGHGNFTHYVQAHFDMSHRTALRFMHVAEVLGPHIETVSGLSQRSLYLLASPSVQEQTRKEILERLEQGEALTYGEIQNHIMGLGDKGTTAQQSAEAEGSLRTTLRIKSFTKNFQHLYTRASHGLQGFSGKVTPAHIEQLQQMQTQLHELDGWISQLVVKSAL